MKKFETQKEVYTSTGLKLKNENPDEFIGLAVLRAAHGGVSLECVFKQMEPHKKTFQGWCNLHVSNLTVNNGGHRCGAGDRCKFCEMEPTSHKFCDVCTIVDTRNLQCENTEYPLKCHGYLANPKKSLTSMGNKLGKTEIHDGYTLLALFRHHWCVTSLLGSLSLLWVKDTLRWKSKPLSWQMCYQSVALWW